MVSKVLSGKGAITTEITPYKEAIHYILTETLKAINQGLTPEEIIEELRLPEQYNNLSQLQQLYGTIPWTNRGIFNSYLGWFDGTPRNLNTMPPMKRVQKRIRLAHSPRSFLNEIKVL